MTLNGKSLKTCQSLKTLKELVLIASNAVGFVFFFSFMIKDRGENSHHISGGGIDLAPPSLPGPHRIGKACVGMF